MEQDKDNISFEEFCERMRTAKDVTKELEKKIERVNELLSQSK